MVHHIKKTEEAIFEMCEIAFLKHPVKPIKDASWKTYRQLGSSYIRHRSKAFLIVKRFDEWRNHSYDRDYEKQDTVYDTSKVEQEYPIKGSKLKETGKVSTEIDRKHHSRELSKYNRESVELKHELNKVIHPNAQLEIRLTWNSKNQDVKNADCIESQIESPYILKLHEYISKTVKRNTAGECAIEIQHTSRAAELSFRYPLQGPDVRVVFDDDNDDVDHESSPLNGKGIVSPDAQSFPS